MMKTYVVSNGRTGKTHAAQVRTRGDGVDGGVINGDHGNNDTASGDAVAYSVVATPAPRSSAPSTYGSQNEPSDVDAARSRPAMRASPLLKRRERKQAWLRSLEHHENNILGASRTRRRAKKCATRSLAPVRLSMQ
ncbi:hypothetical protein CCR75_004802 [Bremia lactucae]|uniref:Uncharacterized protein n=1 Tax=Bremia lactucae TaxID=4779 RepID=A0A976IDE4_BRELC|nr:hypothetical protein CCR75_004802 [Bremia lactucae]